MSAVQRYDAAMPSLSPGYQQGDATPPLRVRREFEAIFDALHITMDLRVRPLDVVAESHYYSPDTHDVRFGARHGPFRHLWAGTVFSDLSDQTNAACVPWLRHALASAARDHLPCAAVLLLPVQAVEVAEAIAKGNARQRPMQVHRVATVKLSTLYSSSRRAVGDKPATLLVHG